MSRREAAAAGGVQPAGRYGRRVRHQEGTRHAHDEKRDASVPERRAPADRRDQVGRERSDDRRPRAVPPTIIPDDKPALVWKPLRGDLIGVAQPKLR
jgi:hypothetical protein